MKASPRAQRGFRMWETDAYLLLITRSIGKGNDAVERVLPVEGSHVYYVGKVYWGSLSESYALFQSGSLARSGVGAERRSRPLDVTKTPSLLLLNGQRTDFEYVP